MAEAAAAPAAPAAPAPTSAPQAPDAKPGDDAKLDEAAPSPVPKRFRLKVNGAEREVEEAQYHTLAQKGLAADERWREAQRVQAERDELERMLQENPIELLRKRGLDVDYLTAQYVLKQAEAEQETPEQRKIREYEEKLQSYEREKAEAAEAERQAAFQAKQEASRQEYGEKFSSALEKAGIPRGPQAAWALSRMAQLEMQNLEQGLEFTADQLAQIVSSDMLTEQHSLFGALDGEPLLERLGPELVQKVTRAVVARYTAEKEKAAGAKPAAPATSPKVRDESGKFVSREEREYDRLLKARL